MTDQATDTAPATADTAPDSSTSQATDTQAQTSDTGTGSDTSTASDTTSTSNEFSLPDEHKEKSWADKIKTQDDLYKQIDNLSELVGKKTIKPLDYETASEEDITAHHATLAPENGAEGYTWGEHSMPEITEPMGDIFVKAGINAHQQKILSEGFDGVIEKIAGDKNEADTSKDGYMKMMEESFGETYENDVGIVEKALKEHVKTDDDKSFLDSADNKTRAVVDRTVHSLVKSYEERIAKILQEHGVTESGSQADGGEGSNTGVNVDEKRAGIRKEIRELEGKPFSHDKIERLKKDLAKTYE